MGTDTNHNSGSTGCGANLHARVADLFTRVIGSTYDPASYQATDEERREMYARNKLENANTAIADYVWLPIQWENDIPKLIWMDSWNPADL